MKEVRLFLLCSLFLAFLFLVATGTVNAATFTVTRSDDRNTVCNSGVDCSLREAVNAANAAASDDVINFNQNLTTITISNEIVIQNAGTLTITGLGANVFTINNQSDPNNQFGNRIFSTNGAVVTITDVRLTGGNLLGGPGGPGGAINVDGGTLVLNRVHVTGNRSGLQGGGINYSGGINHRILNSTISNNSASTGSGGGFYLSTGTPLYVANTTISGNQARIGSMNLGSGGFWGSPTLRNVTITNHNSAGNMNAWVGNPDYRNTIVVGNRGQFPGNSCQVVGDNFIGNGLFESGPPFATCNPATILGSLQDNGGPTPTHALVPGSLAIDAGNNALAVDPFNNSPLLTDQRGFVRIVDGNNDGAAVVDIGAFEFNSTLPPTSPTNLLVNPSFEQGDAPWEDWGNSIVVANPNAPNGSFELRVGTGPGGRNQTVSATPNTTYTLSASGRVSQTGETGWVGVFYLDAAGNQVAPQSLVDFNSTTYERKQIVLQTPANTARLVVWAWKNAGSGFFFVDDFVLTTQQNLLMNPGFEQGETPWEDWGNSSVVAGNAASGNFALRIGTSQGGRYQIVSVTPNTTYTLSASGRVSQAGETGWIGVFYLDAAGNQVAPQSLVDFNSTTYERKQITVQTPANTARLLVWAWKNAGSGFFFVDDFVLSHQ